MFDKDYAFHGTHAEKVISLTAKIGNTGKSLFDRNLDVYLIAPIVGFLYTRTAERNTENGKTTNVLLDALSREKNKLELNYRIIMLLDKVYEPSIEKRIDKVFRVANERREQTDIDKYESYVRGGIDKIYEKLIAPANTPDDYFRLLDEFLEEFNERYNRQVSSAS
jgi:hypothetical protein